MSLDDDWRLAELHMKMGRARDEFLRHQTNLDNHVADRADPPPTNTCTRCRLRSDYHCGRNKVFTGFEPSTGTRLFNWDDLPSYREERESRMPWRCGPKGRFFKSWSDQ